MQISRARALLSQNDNRVGYNYIAVTETGIKQYYIYVYSHLHKTPYKKIS